MERSRQDYPATIGQPFPVPAPLPSGPSVHCPLYVLGPKTSAIGQRFVERLDVGVAIKILDCLEQHFVTAEDGHG